jgi:hypothetical protein
MLTAYRSTVMRRLGPAKRPALSEPATMKGGDDAM